MRQVRRLYLPIEKLLCDVSNLEFNTGITKESERETHLSGDLILESFYN